MMTKTTLSIAAACLAALACQQAAHAEQLMSWTYDGYIGSIAPAYSNSPTPYTDQERATMDAALAGFPRFQSFSATVVVDLDTPYNPLYLSQHTSMFPGAVKSVALSIPQYGVDTLSSPGPNGGAQLHEYHAYFDASDDAAMLAVTAPTVFAGSLGFANYSMAIPGPTPDLHILASLTDVERYSNVSNGLLVAAPGCGTSNVCGSLNLTIRSLSISAVPEPASWASMAAGLLLVGTVVARRRRTGHPGRTSR